MKSIAILLAIVFTCATTPLTAQNPNIIVDKAMTAKIRAEAMSGASQVSPVFDTLTIDIGPRLHQFPGLLPGSRFRRRQTEIVGSEHPPRTLEVRPRVDPRPTHLEMVEPRFMPLIGYAEGWSPSTAGETGRRANLPRR